MYIYVYIHIQTHTHYICMSMDTQVFVKSTNAAVFPARPQSILQEFPFFFFPRKLITTLFLHLPYFLCTFCRLLPHLLSAVGGLSARAVTSVGHVLAPVFQLPLSGQATCPSGHSGTSFCGPPCHSLCLLSGWSSCFLDLVSSSCLVYSPSWSTWSRTGTCQYPNPFRSRVWMADCEQ